MLHCIVPSDFGCNYSNVVGICQQLEKCSPSSSTAPHHQEGPSRLCQYAVQPGSKVKHLRQHHVVDLTLIATYKQEEVKITVVLVISRAL